MEDPGKIRLTPVYHQNEVQLEDEFFEYKEPEYEQLSPEQVDIVVNIYTMDLVILSVMLLCIIYILFRFKKQLCKVTGLFIPSFYVYAILVTGLRIASCIIILRTPKAFLQYIIVDKSPTPSVISVLNTASKNISFCFGWLIVSTLYSTV